MIITCEEDSLSHKYLNNVHKNRRIIKLKSNHIENILFLLAKFIFACIKLWLLVNLSIYLVKGILKHTFFLCLLFLGWLVAWQLAQELLAARHCRVHFVVLCCNKQTSKALQHYDTLVHVFLELLHLVAQEAV